MDANSLGIVGLDRLDRARRYSLREAARILELPEARLRALARAGFLEPQRGPIGPLTFAFQDLLLLRTTRSLLESGVPMRQVRRVWVSLREQLASGAPLTSITVRADGARIVATDGRSQWRADSGQMLLDFDTSEVAERAEQTAGFGRLRLVEPLHDAPVPLRTPVPAPDWELDEDPVDAAAQWYEVGCELEASSADEAREAYGHALDLDPTLADAHINLGRLLHLAGEQGLAEPHYREAVRLDPDDPVPHHNLGVLLEEQGRKDEAVHAYRQAVLRDPDFADAHCNLGLLLAALGRREEAMRHLMAARRLGATRE
jgi:tetratricopeptide (TPR) repeat protein